MNLIIEDRYDTIRYDTIRYDTIRNNTTRYDAIRYNTIRNNTTRYDTIRYDAIDTIRYDAILRTRFTTQWREVFRVKSFKAAVISNNRPSLCPLHTTTALSNHTYAPRWPSGKASASRAVWIEPLFFLGVLFFLSSHNSDCKWLPCQAPGFIGIMLGLVG